MMLGRWDRFHEERGVGPFGSTETYRIGAQWLHGLAVEDWGAGTGWFARFHDNVTTVDGSGTPDVLADLCQYTSEVEGVFMRHVLDHNENWQQILDNASRSPGGRSLPCSPPTKM